MTTIMKPPVPAFSTLLVLLLMGCGQEAKQLFEQAAAREATEGSAAAHSLYQSVVAQHPESRSADRARIKLLEYQQMREREALALFDAADARPETDALGSYRQIVERFPEAGISTIAKNRIARIQARTRAVTFSEDEYRQLAREMLEAHETVGQSLFSETHPTGTYSYTDDPSVTLSLNGKKVVGQFRVHWEGGVLGTPYTTVYGLTVTKSNNYLDVDRLEVVSDNSAFKVDPQILKRFEQNLAAQFRGTPVFNP
ncbi:MAG TPA: hypothetical protein VHG93_26810 [Longimicrobium sp.]|nr:hypothetical protein [Longimicrobium sp.]